MAFKKKISPKRGMCKTLKNFTISFKTIQYYSPCFIFIAVSITPYFGVLLRADPELRALITSHSSSSVFCKRSLSLSMFTSVRFSPGHRTPEPARKDASYLLPITPFAVCIFNPCDLASSLLGPVFISLFFCCPAQWLTPSTTTTTTPEAGHFEGMGSGFTGIIDSVPPAGAVFHFPTSSDAPERGLCAYAKICNGRPRSQTHTHTRTLC